VADGRLNIEGRLMGGRLGLMGGRWGRRKVEAVFCWWAELKACVKEALHEKKRCVKEALHERPSAYGKLQAGWGASHCIVPGG
jgi:hypothetical protein